jgi:ankyrin repeat protein
MLSSRIEANTTCRIIGAVQKGNVQLIRVLFDCGNPIDEVDRSGDTALHIAVRNGDSQVISALCDCCSDPGFLNQENREGLTALMIAVKKKNRRVARLLLTKGANPNSTDRAGATSLHHAVYMGCARIVHLLLDHGAWMYHRDNSSYTPLLLCASTHPDIFIHFANHVDFQQAGRYMKSHMGYAITHLAFKSANFDLLRLLLDLDIWDVNTPDAQGDTLLHSAARDGRAVLVRLLLQRYRASLDVRNHDERTPMDLARESVLPRGGNRLGRPDHAECITLLMASEADNWDLLEQFCLSNNRSVVGGRRDIRDDLLRKVFEYF